MIGIFKRKIGDDGTPLPEPKFKKGDIGFTLKDKEKVLILKQIGDVSEDRNGDLGPTYLVRGDKQFCFKLYECEILTLEETMS